MGGGDDLARLLRTQLVDTCLDAETARRSCGRGSTGQSRSLRSEFCRLKVAWRGNPVTGRSLASLDGGLFGRPSGAIEGQGE